MCMQFSSARVEWYRDACYMPLGILFFILYCCFSDKISKLKLVRILVKLKRQIFVTDYKTQC